MTLLRLSDLNHRFAELQGYETPTPASRQLIIFGGSAYPIKTHIRSYVHADEDIPNKVKLNSALKRVRVSIEWDYGGTANSFKYLANYCKLKLLESTTVSKIYTVATILRNIRSGTYGNQSSNFFSIPVRENFVTHYLNQTDFE